MTPEMAKRVEFLREAAAKGYSSRWMAGELGFGQKYINEICRKHGIKVGRSGINIAQGHKRNQTGYYRKSHLPDEGIDACADFLPDVGEV